MADTQSEFRGGIAGGLTLTQSELRGGIVGWLTLTSLKRKVELSGTGGC